jgi:DNA-binding NarL/FixJ family response regulator
MRSRKQNGVEAQRTKRPIERTETMRVLLAEDHAIVRDGLAAMIDQEPDMTVVAQASNGREAVDRWLLHRPDVTLMDLQMPILNGVDAIREIRGIDAEARIVVLTTFDGDEDIYRGMKAGAKSYLLKDANRDELFQCIRMVHAGASWVPPGIAAKLLERLTGDELTKRESEVLDALAKGMSNKEIGASLYISEGTVKVHVKAIFGKLAVLSRTEAIAVATRRGLIKR